MKYRLSAVLAGLLSAVPSAVSACAVCFGGADSDLRKGFTWGVLILLLLPFVLTAGFIGMVVKASRKSRQS